ncbi:UDP diphosphate synthase [Pelagibacteraceae bacterium GOM-A1]|nr:UDP diphosphate synthase [Pelagibacteraceae bacterium GOM-A1]
MISPKHIAIIMDGNGRWGIAKKNSRNYGHKKGLATVEKVIDAAIENKIKYLTLYVFSTENWKRPINEINYLLKLLSSYISKEINNLLKRDIRIKVIGNIKQFPRELKLKLNKVEKLTKNNKTIQINMALNYGSRQELVGSIKKLIQKKKNINEKNIEKYLYTYGVPDPDILIRTGNTNRISNFLIWQLIYTEIFFIKKMWPDFTKKDFKQIINKFKKINRNFGGLNVRIN